MTGAGSQGVSGQLIPALILEAIGCLFLYLGSDIGLGYVSLARPGNFNMCYAFQPFGLSVIAPDCLEVRQGFLPLATPPPPSTAKKALPPLTPLLGQRSGVGHRAGPGCALLSRGVDMKQVS